MNRREFLLSLATTPLLLSCNESKSRITGQLFGSNFKTGHLLRDGNIPPFTQTKHTSVAIIGGGVSGLTAGWYLRRNGIVDYKIFELENEVGGNSRSGNNGVSAYPWGAHYLPIPNAEASLLKHFLSECGAIIANYESDKPTYNERYLCFSPEERLFIHGMWQEGLIPQNGLSKEEKAELIDFESEMQRFRFTIGKDGKPAFTIPISNSSQDPEFTQLDRISMQQYLHEKGWHTKPLHWYANYACRDDYGMHHRQISAWAGIHYFAARRGLGQNAEMGQELTWPEGNAWLTSALKKHQQESIYTQALVFQIEIEQKKTVVDVFDLKMQRTTRWIVDDVIYASPLHTLPYVLRNHHQINEAAKTIKHAPWLVANLTIEHPEFLDGQFPLAWDNVIYDSNALGYVNANHQDLRIHHDKSVITYYQSYGELSNQSARKLFQEKNWDFFANSIIRDLKKAHPNIQNQLKNLDIWHWGHAMTYPKVGFLSDKQRLLLNQPIDSLYIAHTDAAGISIFEEAFNQGAQAAKAVLSASGQVNRLI